MRPRNSKQKMNKSGIENDEIGISYFQNMDMQNGNKIVPVFENRVGNFQDNLYNVKQIEQMNRIPKIDDLNGEYAKDNIRNQKRSDTTNINITNQNILNRKSAIVFGNLRPSNRYKNFGITESALRRSRKDKRFYNYCLVSVCCSFLLGLIIGIILMGTTQTRAYSPNLRARMIINDSIISTRTLNSLKVDPNVENVITNTKYERKDKLLRFSAVSFEATKKLHPSQGLDKKDVYPKGLTDDMKEILKDIKIANRKIDKHAIITATKVNKANKTENFVPNDMTVLYGDVFWGPEVENSMPQGYGASSADIWERYVNHSEVAKMESGCGRMQNRLITFKDGVQACVRYRQNTDQIQGEIFSFYVAKLLNLTNVAPSVVKVVDVKDKLWQNVAEDINSAQWSSNRAVVLTQYIPSLESAKIPDVFKPATRHLNKDDVMDISLKENDTENTKKILIEKLKTKQIKINKENMSNFDHIDMKLNKKTIDSFVELAQWSDLIIFDYLTANLDRIVNNLFNFQWNINIMDGPAHNLARKMDSGLLLFLDNESGLLHGYRLLKKYNVYHSLMLDNLCVFRKATVDALKTLHKQSIGSTLSEMFHAKNNAVIRDILPPLPEKNAKILHERIGKVLSQIEKCQDKFSNR